MAELTVYRLWSLCCAGHVYINVELKPDKDKKGKVGFFFFSTLIWCLCQPWLLVLLFQLLRKGMSTLASVMCIHTTGLCICVTILCTYTTVVGVCTTVICSDTTVVCVDKKPHSVMYLYHISCLDLFHMCMYFYHIYVYLTHILSTYTMNMYTTVVHIYTTVVCIYTLFIP